MDKFDWANKTEVHPLGLAVLAVLALSTFALPRKYAPIPILIMACMIPSRQRIVIFELDWTYLRLLVLAGWMRVFALGDRRTIKWIPLDKCVIAISLVTIVASTLRTGSADIFIRAFGTAFDNVGMYFLFRIWIRNWGDVDAAIRALIVISVPVAVAMTYEHLTTRNVFHVFGGVPEFTLIREGKLRCQGAFSHPILAGCFWASLLPLFAAQAMQRRTNLLWPVLGVATSILCINYSASSTPVMGALMAVIGGAFFVVRERMRLVRWSLVGVLMLLQIVMNAPVYHLIARIDIVGGSTGWQRYYLIDRSIRNFTQWVLLGVSSTGHWGPNLSDITNEYLVRGFSGGITALGIFVAIIVFGYQAAGRIRLVERGNRPREILAWALGVSLFTHTMMFLAVSYFGQIEMIFTLLLAILGSLSTRRAIRNPRKVIEPDLGQAQPVARDLPLKSSLGGNLIGRGSALGEFSALAAVLVSHQTRVPSPRRAGAAD